MSDELTPGRSELASGLRELAQAHESPVTVPGTEIRRRAVRRRRRRRTASLATVSTAGAGALALVLTLAFTGGEGSRPTPPAAGYGARTPSVSAVPSPKPVAATVDLGRRELVAEGRRVPISSGTIKSPTPTGLMTVIAKYKAATVPGESAGWSEYDVKATWVMRLRGPDHRTNYLLALNWDEKAPGNYDITGGAIGLRRVDAMWLYEALRPGAVVRVVGRTPTLPGETATPSRTPPGDPTARPETTAGRPPESAVGAVPDAATEAAERTAGSDTRR
ncbi:L,D-transpeptidase [Streptomyces sp. CWNU-52B]|uniref:L,D-transpeptidase n=1 Tax=unclassified Streptomyces TaxID=2593676 RepID=UPI0039C10F94